MLGFGSSLSSDSEAFAIFVNEKFSFKDRKNVLSKDINRKINSYLAILKDKKNEEEISSLDLSAKQKCFIIKVKKKYETYYPEEKGGIFYSYLKNFKSIKKIDIYVDSLDLGKEELINFSFICVKFSLNTLYPLITLALLRKPTFQSHIH